MPGPGVDVVVAIAGSGDRNQEGDRHRIDRRHRADDRAQGDGSEAIRQRPTVGAQVSCADVAAGRPAVRSDRSAANDHVTAITAVPAADAGAKDAAVDGDGAASDRDEASCIAGIRAADAGGIVTARDGNGAAADRHGAAILQVPAADAGSPTLAACGHRAAADAHAAAGATRSAADARSGHTAGRGDRAANDRDGAAAFRVPAADAGPRRPAVGGEGTRGRCSVVHGQLFTSGHPYAGRIGAALQRIRSAEKERDIPATVESAPPACRRTHRWRRYSG